MNERRSPFRRAAERSVAMVLSLAAARGLTAKGLRALLRVACASLVDNFGSNAPKAPRSIWYRAVKTVTGTNVLDLPDPCQVTLLRADKTRPRRRRKESHAAR